MMLIPPLYETDWATVHRDHEPDVDELKKKISKIISIYEVEVAKRKIKQLLDDYQSIATNVCVLGARGSGKSSFINNMMGEKIAKTGVKETTKNPNPYPNPNNENIIFWDLPGYGDKQFPRTDDYLRALSMDRYDIILFLHKDSFQADDMAVYKAVQALNKPIFFIRTRFDIDCQDGNENRIKHEIRSDLKTKNLPPDKLNCYFISNRNHAFDYNTLMQDILAETDKTQAEAFVRTIKTANRDLLANKKRALEKRIWTAAVVGASIGAMPVPCTGLFINTALLLRETLFMANVLGVRQFIEEKPEFEEYRKYVNEPGLVATLQNNAMVSAKYFACDIISLVPGIGSIISSTLDYNIAMGTLSKVLRDFLEVAEYKMGLEEREALPADF